MSFILAVHITPKSAKNQIIGWVDGTEGGKILKIKIAAPPEDGKANAELLRFLSKIWGIPKRDIELASGDTSRHKRLKIHDDSVEDWLSQNCH